MTSGDQNSGMETSAAKPYEPLMDESSTRQFGMKSYSTRTKFIIAVIVAVILILTIYLIVAGVAEIWPFDESSSSSRKIEAGPFGEWPLHGGNAAKQQTPFNAGEVELTKANIDSLEMLCSYVSENGESHTGFMLVDDSDNVYWADRSGFVMAVRLQDCREIWRVNIAQALGYNDRSSNYMITRNSLALYQDKDGVKQVLVPTPNRRQNMEEYDPYFPCYLLSLDMKTGETLWSVNLGEGVRYQTCQVHGCTVDADYAYCGQSSQGSTSKWWIFPFDDEENGEPRPNAFRGNLKKIDLYTHAVVDEFFTIPDNDAETCCSSYTGNALWPAPALYGDYIAFGVGNLYSYPDYIGECMMGDFDALPIEDAYPYNACGEDLSDNPFYRCLEKDVMVDSIVVINKTTFELVFYVPVQGVDAYRFDCVGFEAQNTSGCPAFPGPDADMQLVSFYKNEDTDTLYVVGHQKSSQFFLVEVPSGEVKISKKIGPWTVSGGPMWSLGVAQAEHIAIASNIGSYGGGGGPWEMADGTTVCSTGVVNGVDLHTGYTLWQIVNPYGRFHEDCNTTQYNEYIDYSVHFNVTCERAFDGSEMLGTAETCADKVYVPAMNEPLPQSYQSRGKFTGGISVANGMIFIPSMTGDVFIHDLMTGEYLHSIVCPVIDPENSNRAGIRSGVTVFNDRLTFFCGASGSATEGDLLVSWRLA